MADDLSTFVPDVDDLSSFVPDSAAQAQSVDPRAYRYGHVGNAPLPAPTPAQQRQIAQQVIRSQPLSQTLQQEAQASLGTGGRIGLQAGLALAGQKIGQESGIPGGQFVGGGLGAATGNAINQAMGTKPFSLGQVAESGMMGAIPIAPAETTAADIAVQAGKYAAAGAAGKAAQISIDQGPAALSSEDSIKKMGTSAVISALAAPISTALDRGASAAAQAIRQGNNSEMKASIVAANEAGFKVLPADTNPNMVNKTVQTVAGKVASGQAAKIHNQGLADGLVRQQLGIADGVPLTSSTIAAARNAAGSVYQEVAALSPQAEQAVNGWKDANKLANQWQNYHDMNWAKLTPTETATATKNADTFSQMADSYETDMANIAKAAGKPELIPALNAARAKIAQTYIADKALWQGTGHVDPEVFASVYQKSPELMTGNFGTLGRSANALSKVIRSTDSVSQPGGTAQALWESGAGAMGGYNVAGIKGAVAGAALPLVHPAARGLEMSAPYQRIMGLPSYAAPQADFLARMASQGVLQQSADPQQ